ncbi:MAG: hypothetical protein ACKUBY_00060 [Candidatus Moraniibacteriota bacterium]|jgi:hypothetical protein
MKVTNNATFSIIAFCYDTAIGYGNDVEIQSNKSEEVEGPYLGEMGSGSCRVHIDGSITCHEAPDDEKSFEIQRGAQLCLRSGDKGIIVRHHLDEPEDYVIEWRETQI